MVYGMGVTVGFGRPFCAGAWEVYGEARMCGNRCGDIVAVELQGDLNSEG